MENKSEITWKKCLMVCVSAFLLFLGIYYWKTIADFISVAINAAMPIIIGFAIAYVLNILMSFYERHYFKKAKKRELVDKTRTPVCLVCALLTMFGIIGIVVLLVVPELVSCIEFLISEIPPLIKELLKEEWVQQLVPAETLSELAQINWPEYITSIASMLASGLGDAMSVFFSAVSSVFSVVVTALIAIIFSVYLLLCRDTLLSQSTRLLRCYLPEKATGTIMHIFHVLNDRFHRYFVGQFIEAIILGALCCIGMLIFGFPYAAMIGTLVGFTALIPIAGAYIGAGVGALMMLTESPLKAVLFLIFIVVLQQLEGNLIYPKVVGDSISLPAIWVLAAVTVGGGLMGITGMVIGVPITAAIYQLVLENMQQRERDTAAEQNMKNK